MLMFNSLKRLNLRYLKSDLLIGISSHYFETYDIFVERIRVCLNEAQKVVHSSIKWWNYISHRGIKFFPLLFAIGQQPNHASQCSTLNNYTTCIKRISSDTFIQQLDIPMLLQRQQRILPLEQQF